MRGIFLRTGLCDKRLVCLFQLWLWHHTILLLLRHGNVFHVLVLKHLRFRRIAVNYRNIALRAGNFRLRFEQHTALVILDFTDEVRVNQEAAVSHDRIPTRHLQRRERSRA